MPSWARALSSRPSLRVRRGLPLRFAGVARFARRRRVFRLGQIFAQGAQNGPRVGYLRQSSQFVELSHLQSRALEQLGHLSRRITRPSVLAEQPLGISSGVEPGSRSNSRPPNSSTRWSGPICLRLARIDSPASLSLRPDRQPPASAPTPRICAPLDSDVPRSLQSGPYCPAQRARRSNLGKSLLYRDADASDQPGLHIAQVRDLIRRKGNHLIPPQRHCRLPVPRRKRSE